MNELALFAGGGGGILGGKLLGWRTVCAVEINAFCARRLMQRQNEGFLPPFPIWDDVCTFDGYPWRGIVDVVSGGFPCQDISIAGQGDGLDGERSGLWMEMARILCEVRPQFAFVENSPMLTSRGLGRVLGDLAEMGFNAEWGVLGASDVGAPHQRDRCWILAYADGARLQDGWAKSDGPLAGCCKAWEAPKNIGATITEPSSFRGWPGFAAEPAVGRVADGVADRVDRLRTLGNGQVPICAAEAWLRLLARV